MAIKVSQIGFVLGAEKYLSKSAALAVHGKIKYT
jgi:hypothetical protein